MTRWSSLSLALVSALLPASLAACTKHNPRDCSDGACTDPAFPFCDVGGEVDHVPLTCIAVACQPSTFAACRGDAELTCNAAGTDYDAVQCAHGCDPTFGCRVCEANQSACTNGKAQTCDATGKVTASQDCPLGCFEDQPRCRDIDPSNGLAMYLDMAAGAPDLELADGDKIYTDTGTIAHGGNPPVKLPGFHVSPQSGGSAIWVLVANHVQLRGKVSVGSFGTSVAPALAIIANDAITVSGELRFDIAAVQTGVTAGGVSFADCVGRAGKTVISGGDTLYAASGGGGHATVGGAGGNIGESDFLIGPGGAAGKASGNPTLVPLRGGCAGGSENLSVETFPPAGGGALQMSSRTKIEMSDNSLLNLNGSSGPDEAGLATADGGGAGGGILLEAPSVRLGNGARLLVNGGAGIINGFLPTSLTATPTPGQPCIPPALCSAGGNGAAQNGPATAGGDIPYNGSTGGSHIYQSGSGGGGLGFIRINTATGTYTKANTTIESGVLTTGMIKTR